MEKSGVRETPRIGVFVCRCGFKRSGAVDFSEVVKYAKTLPNVIFADESPYFCSEEGIKAIKDAIKNRRLNRVVVAACSPRIIEPLFSEACEDAGLNKNLICVTNVREQCSWVHQAEPKEATEKAKDLVRMAVAGARVLEPYEEEKIEVKPSALVIGAGVSGMTCALSLANQGFAVHIVEKESKVGGLLNRIYKLYPTNREASEIVDSLVKSLERKENINLLLSSTVKDVKGYVGNFDVTVLKESGKEVNLNIGTIIVATGAVAFEPLGMYGYGEYEGVVTQLEFEELLRNNLLKKPSKVVMIQCVGDREETGRTYCSRICCMVAIKNSTLIKGMYPETDVYILYRDLQTYGKENEQYHLRARAQGIKFVEYSVDRPPEVTKSSNGKLMVKVYHSLLGEELQIDTDLVILSTPLIQHREGKELSRILKVPLGPDEFFSDYRVKIRPVEFMIDGIYVCGTAQGPKDVNESIIQAYAAASRAAIPMSAGIIRRKGTAVVNEDLCVGCGTCVDLCAFEAHFLEEGKSKVIEALCKGCGACAAGCPQRAISMKEFSDEQVMAEIREAFA